MSDNLSSLSTKFSISNFLSDLPRMLNDAFGAIVECIMSFYDPESKALKSERLETNYIEATTIVTQNIRFNSDNGVVYDLENIGNEIEDIKRKLNEFTPILKSQIDQLDAEL